MDIESIARRYELLIDELNRLLSTPGKWHGVPGMLDELHSLRRAYRAALK